MEERESPEKLRDSELEGQKIERRIRDDTEGHRLRGDEGKDDTEGHRLRGDDDVEGHKLR